MPGTQILDFDSFKGELMLSGGFDTVNNFTTGGVITWDGIQFDSLTDDMGNWGYDIDATDSILAIGGTFSDISNTTYDNIVIWDGTDITNLGTLDDGPGTTVRVVHIMESTVFFAGNFAGMPFLPQSKRVASYNPTLGWDDLNEGVWSGGVDDVHCFGEFNNNLIVGGLFTHAGNPMKLVNNIAIWDGDGWHDMDGGVNYNVWHVVTDTTNNFLYAAGGFTTAGGVSTGMVARWDGYHWSQVGRYFDGSPTGNSLCMYRNELFVGGAPLVTNGDLSNHIMKFDGETWSEVNGGVNDNLSAMHVYQDTLWVAGGFDTVGMGVENLPTYRLAKWWMPANTHCNWLQPIIYTNDDQPVFKDSIVPLYNNNAYAQSWDWRIDGSSVYSNYDPTHTFTDTGWHDVEVIVSQDGCMDTAMVQVYVEEPVSVLERSQIDFEVFPNPSSGQFTIQLEQPYGIDIRIINLEGKTIYQQPATSSTTQIITEAWAKGNYVIQLSQEGNLAGSKTIIID